MDDVDDYGNELHHYSLFRDAIGAGVIADYEIIIEIYLKNLGSLHLDKILYLKIKVSRTLIKLQEELRNLLKIIPLIKY